MAHRRSAGRLAALATTLALMFALQPAPSHAQEALAEEDSSAEVSQVTATEDLSGEAVGTEAADTPASMEQSDEGAEPAPAAISSDEAFQPASSSADELAEDDSAAMSAETLDDDQGCGAAEEAAEAAGTAELAEAAEATAASSKEDASDEEPEVAEAATAPADVAPRNGWYEAKEGKVSFYRSGKKLANCEFVDPDTQRRYYADKNGVIVRSKDMQLKTDGGKLVRYDADGCMVFGEHYAKSSVDGKWHWSYFDTKTGAMAKGFTWIPSNGGKWCYYDTHGWMLYGQQYIKSYNGVWNWYLFDQYTGATRYGWQYIKDQNKWCYYDKPNGWMLKGSHVIEGKPEYLDPQTGRRWTRDEVVNKVISIAASQNNLSPANIYVEALRKAGGNIDWHGACLTYVWWCFEQAGMHYQFLNGELATGWPNEACDWLAAHGQLVHENPKPGDIWLTNHPGDGPAPATHAGLVASYPYQNARKQWVVNVWQHVRGQVRLVVENMVWSEGHSYNGNIAGYGRLWLNG